MRKSNGPSILTLSLLLIAAPSTAWAYIDPGIISMAAQALFAMLFGGMAVWIAKPWTFVKRLFVKSGHDNKGPDEALRKEQGGGQE